MCYKHTLSVVASRSPVAVGVGRTRRRADAKGDGITGGGLLIVLELEAEGAVKTWFSVGAGYQVISEVRRNIGVIYR